MSGNLWHQVFSVGDRAWVLCTSNGNIRKQCRTFAETYHELVSVDMDPDDWDEFCLWKRNSGRTCVRFALIKLAQQRLREKQDHGPPIPPFEEM